MLRNHVTDTIFLCFSDSGQKKDRQWDSHRHLTFSKTKGKGTMPDHVFVIIDDAKSFAF